MALGLMDEKRLFMLFLPNCSNILKWKHDANDSFMYSEKHTNFLYGMSNNLNEQELRTTSLAYYTVRCWRLFGLNVMCEETIIGRKHKLIIVQH